MERILIINGSVGIVVLCIVAARKMFLYRLPGSTWLFLWKILILRLLFPFTFELQFTNIDMDRNIANFLQLQEKIELSSEKVLLLSVDQVMHIIWLIGVVIVAGLFVGSHLMQRRLYCMALPVKGVYFEKWKEVHSLKRKVDIKESDRIARPLTYGVIRPIILLPAHRNIEEDRLTFVLELEFIHIKQMDVLLKWILVLVCSVYWYNPLIWVMYFGVNRDMELACDERLLRHQGQEYRKKYLQVLVNWEEKKAESGILCSSFCKYPMEERIKVMVKTGKEKSNHFMTAWMLVCLVAILSIGTTVRAETPSFYDETKSDGMGYNEGSGEVPNILGLDDENAGEILWKQGFSYEMELAFSKKS